MSFKPPDPKWTPKSFETLVEKYVFRVKIRQAFKNAIAQLDEDRIIDKVFARKLVKILYTNSSEMEEIYGPPDDLIHNLHMFQRFPNNAKFLGIENSLNYLASPFIMTSADGTLFISALEAFIIFKQNSAIPVNKFNEIYFKYVGDKLAYLYKDNFKIIPLTPFVNRMREVVAAHPQKQFKNQPIDEVLPEIFPENSNEIKKIKTILEEQVENHTEIYSCLQRAHFICQELFFSEEFNEKYPIVRAFEEGVNKDKLFFIARELENAVSIAMKKRHNKPFPRGLIPLELEEETRVGVLRTVEYTDFLKIMRILKLPIADVNVINLYIQQTDRENPIPVPTPHGTYCKLARHAFYDLFEQIVTGIKLFRGCNKKDYPKIHEWFKKFNEGDEIFSTSRKYRYFIEYWKIEEITNRAYEELGKLVTEEIYQPPAKSRFSKQEVLNELYKFAPNFNKQDKLRWSYNFYVKNKPNNWFTKTDIIKFYEFSILNTFREVNQNYLKFLENQGIVENLESFSPDQVGTSDSSENQFDDFANQYKKAFLKILNKIPTDEFIKKDQMYDMIFGEMGRNEYGLSVKPENRKTMVEMSQFVMKYVENVEKNGEEFVKRRIDPIDDPDYDAMFKILASDPKLAGLMTGVKRNRTDLNAEIRERLEEKLDEADDSETQTILKLLEKF